MFGWDRETLVFRSPLRFIPESDLVRGDVPGVGRGRREDKQASMKDSTLDLFLSAWVAKAFATVTTEQGARRLGLPSN